MLLDNYIVYVCIGPHDVRIRMKSVGICGSDVHYLKVLSNLSRFLLELHLRMCFVQCLVDFITVNNYRGGFL